MSQDVCDPPLAEQLGFSSPEIIFISQSRETVTLLEPKELQDFPEFKIKSHSVDVPS